MVSPGDALPSTDAECSFSVSLPCRLLASYDQGALRLYYYLEPGSQKMARYFAGHSA